MYPVASSITLGGIIVPRSRDDDRWQLLALLVLGLAAIVYNTKGRALWQKTSTPTTTTACLDGTYFTTATPTEHVAPLARYSNHSVCISRDSVHGLSLEPCRVRARHVCNVCLMMMLCKALVLRAVCEAVVEGDRQGTGVLTFAGGVVESPREGGGEGGSNMARRCAMLLYMEM